jgi:putative hemolysin
LLHVADINAEKGGLLLRMADGAEEIEACQRLRYRVFYEELCAVPLGDMASRQMDSDRFDGFCDHLVVVRRSTENGEDAIRLRDGELVGTYRLLRQDVAGRNGGFYTQNEFDIAPLLASHPELRFLELGRSCVLKPYRTKPVVELLWQGIWNYVRAHDLHVMFGCASLEGTDPEEHATALGFLAQAAAPPEWAVSAHSEHRIEMRRIATDGLDQRRALKELPPLVKGYLRLGCYIGDGAVVDRQFNTIDVLIILPVSAINARYFSHFGEPNG